MSDTERLYVYAVVPAGRYRPSVSGIDGAPLHLVGDKTGPLAVVHKHTGGPYDGPDEAVREWVLGHSEVIEDGWKHADSVLPVSFNVIVAPDSDSGASADEQLRGWLADSEHTLTQRLEELSGTSELRVEISLVRSLVGDADEEIEALKADIDDRPAGVRRLLEKRLEKAERELVDRAADGLYPDVRTRLASHCLALEEYRPAARESGTTPVLMASCLATEAGILDLGAELSALRREHPAVSVRFLGPWPPYSFVDLSENELWEKR